MRAWRLHTFENDDAVEWAAGYREMGLDLAASTIGVALEDHSNNRLSAGIAMRALAAVEAVAHALGRGSAHAAKVFEGAPAADRNAAEAMRPNADEVISAVARGSELVGIWKGSGEAEFGAWVQSLEDLRTRLHGGASAARAPETSAPAPAPAVAGGDVAEAILALSRDIELLRHEMAENFARLARQIEGTGR